jgi:nucleoside-diphosphate kinase
MITFAMIKPHAVKNPVVLNQIMQIIESNNFRIVKKVRVKFDVKKAESFYEEHKGKFYFNRLVTFMSR